MSSLPPNRSTILYPDGSPDRTTRRNPGTLSIDHALIVPLIHHRAKSGYRGVYEYKGDTYHAKVRVGGVLQAICGPTPKAAQAATLLAEWYRDTFGEHWAKVIKYRMRKPWHAWYSRAHEGWLLAVWEFGERMDVVERRVRRWNPGTGVMEVLGVPFLGNNDPQERLRRRQKAEKQGRRWRAPNVDFKVFGSHAAAKNFVARWLHLRYGMFTPFVAYWVSQPPPKGKWGKSGRTAS